MQGGVFSAIRSQLGTTAARDRMDQIAAEESERKHRDIQVRHQSAAAVAWGYIFLFTAVTCLALHEMILGTKKRSALHTELQETALSVGVICH